ncbi:MAG TPA: hypothetical protein VNZ64_02905 [Candidatus Acidoferrum sp.]|jgi:hypothetical protein|nr:hypothetical protein [Candidatus Acidoferrum sp.]
MPKTASKSKAVAGRGREFLLHAPEICIFSACLELVQELRTLDRTFKAGKTDRAAFVDRVKALLSQLSRTAEATDRFDIVMPVASCGRFSPSFWRWFNWWNDYHIALPPAQIAQIERLGREHWFAIKNHRPEGDWLTYRQTPVFELEMI